MLQFFIENGQPFDGRISYLLRIVKETRSSTVYFIILQAHMYLFLPYQFCVLNVGIKSKIFDIEVQYPMVS